MPFQTEATVLDMNQLRDITLEDAALMRELVLALIDDTARQIVPLQNAIEQADAGQCARLAHYLKGACANLGAVSMAAILNGIETQAKTGDFAACRESLVNLSAELQKFAAHADAL